VPSSWRSLLGDLFLADSGTVDRSRLSGSGLPGQGSGSVALDPGRLVRDRPSSEEPRPPRDLDHQNPGHGAGLVGNHVPNGAEDETGNRPLLEPARGLKHADFFAGLLSGLVSRVWAMGTPVVRTLRSHPTPGIQPLIAGMIVPALTGAPARGTIVKIGDEGASLPISRP
jgi:hypothetical protein